MNRKSLIWYVATVVLSMVLNSTVVFASDDSTDFESESNTLSTYETSDGESVSPESTYVETSLTSAEGEEYTTTLEVSSVESTESLEEVTTIDSLTPNVESMVSTTLEDTSYTTTELESTYDSSLVGSANGLEENSYVEGNVYILNPSETLNANNSEVYIESNSTSYELSQTSNLVHTLSNTTIKNDDSSPKTNHVAVIVPILLVMAGALFIGATSTPKRQ